MGTEEGIGGFAIRNVMFRLPLLEWKGSYFKRALVWINNNKGNTLRMLRTLFPSSFNATHSYNKYLYKYPQNKVSL
jgi:hypothetical protein